MFPLLLQAGPTVRDPVLENSLVPHLVFQCLDLLSTELFKVTRPAMEDFSGETFGGFVACQTWQKLQTDRP